MLPYFVLLIVLFALFLTAYRFSGAELLAPSPLFLLGMVISVVLALVGTGSWNRVTLGWETELIVFLGCLAVFLGSLLAELCTKRFRGNRTFSRCVEKCDYEARAWKYLVVIGILLLAIVVRVAETYGLAQQNDILGNGYFETAKNVREAFAYFKTSDGLQIGVGYSMLERQLEKLVDVCSYVLAFICAWKIESKAVPKQLALPLLALSVAFVYYLLSAGRASILFVCIAFVSSYVILRLNHGFGASLLSKRILLIGTISAVFVAVMFYVSGYLIARPPSGDIVEYISFYFGAGVPSLQSILDQGMETDGQTGTLTFYYLFSFFYKIGLIDSLPNYSIAWINLDGHYSNIFTCFARYYIDFGYPGVVLLGFFCGVFLTFVYRWARCASSPFAVVLMGYLAPYIFDMARDEFVFSRLLSANGLMIVGLMFIATLFLTMSLRERWCRMRENV